MRGQEKVIRRMANMKASVVREGTKLVYALADMHVTEAALSITRGAVSGKNHVASAPGEPPNADTHQLDRSGHVELAGPLQANSVFDAPHAGDMEFGNSKVAARPFARPAAKRVRAKAEPLRKAALQRIINGGTL